MNMRPLDEETPEHLETLPEVDRIRRLEANDRTTIIERRRIVSLQRSQLWGVLALIVLLVVIGGLYGKAIDHNSGKVGVAERNLHDYEVAVCRRADERTAADNLSQQADYAFFTETSTLLRVSLAQPRPEEAALSPAQRAARRAQTLKFVAGLEADAQDKVWHHLIRRCAYAVDHPETYRLPVAVPFSKAPPPPSALHAPAS